MWVWVGMSCLGLCVSSKFHRLVLFWKKKGGGGFRFGLIGTYYILSIGYNFLWSFMSTFYMVYLKLSGSKGFIFRDSLIVECFLISSKAAGSKKIKPKSLAQKKTHKTRTNVHRTLYRRPSIFFYPDFIMISSR